jgi:acyl homoserine lactone synthase
MIASRISGIDLTNGCAEGATRSQFSKLVGIVAALTSLRTRAVFFNRFSERNLFDSVARFRKQLFVDICGWDVTHSDEFEIDEFDQAGTVYCALLAGTEVVGTFRVNRTDGPYLAADVFSELAEFQPYPRCSDCWEVSRFGVLPRVAPNLARDNYALMFRFASAVGANELVAMADLTYERYLSVLGVRTRRFGLPRVIGVDRFGHDLWSVAGAIPIREQHGHRFARLIEIANQMEISDVGDVLGPARLSA